MNALLSGLLRVLVASAVSGAVTWLVVSPSHVCDSNGGWSLTGLLIFLPTAAGLLVAFRPYSPLVLALAAMAASITVAWVYIAESLDDGMVSPSGSQCEPSPAGAVMLVPLTFLFTTALLVVFYVLGIREKVPPRY
jgi:hypothetical protein